MILPMPSPHPLKVDAKTKWGTLFGDTHFLGANDALNELASAEGEQLDIKPDSHHGGPALGSEPEEPVKKVRGRG